MSRKKLVVSGDSWTAGTAYAGQRLDGPFAGIWPEYLGDMLNMDVINVGWGGVGNEFIYNKIVDELSSIKDIGLAVACWSGHDRWDFNLFGERRRKTLRIDPSVEDPYTGWIDSEFLNRLKPIVNILLEMNMVSTEHNFFKTLRWYNAFQNYCESNNIPYMQCSAFNVLSDDVISLMLDHPIFYKMNEDHFYGWPMFSQIGGFSLSDKLNEVDPERKNLRISDEDTHPNTEGHKFIAELFYKQYELVYD